MNKNMNMNMNMNRNEKPSTELKITGHIPYGIAGRASAFSPIRAAFELLQVLH